MKNIKVLSVFCLLLLLQSMVSAKLIVADTVGHEKIIRSIAFSLDQARSIEIKPAKLSDALRDLRQGKINLLVSDEKLDSNQRTQLKVNCYRYALAPLFFVVSSTNRISSLSAAQLKEVLRGNIMTWRPLGGEAYTIHLAIVKDDQPGIRTLHKKFLPKSEIKAKYFEVTNKEGISILACANGRLLGVCGFVNLPLAAKPLSVDGIAPTTANIRSGKYQPVMERWIWISARDEYKETLEHKAALEFIKLLRDKQTVKLIEDCGFLPNTE